MRQVGQAWFLQARSSCGERALGQCLSSVAAHIAYRAPTTDCWNLNSGQVTVCAERFASFASAPSASADLKELARADIVSHSVRKDSSFPPVVFRDYVGSIAFRWARAQSGRYGRLRSVIVRTAGSSSGFDVDDPGAWPAFLEVTDLDTDLSTVNGGAK